MASAKQFMGNTCASNKKIAALIKHGSKQKITECEVKQVAVTKEECIGIKVFGCDLWIRINSTNLGALGSKFGDDTEKWPGKQVVFNWGDSNVNGVLQKSLILVPQ